MSSHPRPPRSRVGRKLETWSRAVTAWTGSSWAFAIAAAIIIAWLVTGPIFHFSDTWQLVINTGTTVVTFLMVFLIQRAQNKDSLAIQLKLNELVAALEGASNRLVDVESFTESELATLHEHFAQLAKMARQQGDIHQSHSVDEALARHQRKKASGQDREEVSGLTTESRSA